ncbi:MerR family transcriptional regulator [Bacillus pumilus]|uniref:MerR family transcriptional regulator n=1 Tax=Bacillus TaxID=1386 RepID=UPI000AFDC941|nr:MULTISPECIES: MerR family transcriptional regulator [Bacillus]MCI4617672.1 MerR family transcriptional regulator [Bacillus pumilus]MCP1528837.1 DNA-binding transcriptional MerR regulator [Bacillus pumilus]MDF9784221.1 DNA-binding transcriptional MerR regulator [Bacillus pumilus]
MKVKEVAELFGISIRTLHHYDQIGLLIPKEVTDNRYRLYSEENLETLQQILFFRELGFPLKEIKKMMHNPSFEKKEAFILQRKMLIEKRDKFDKMIENIDKTLQHLMGESLYTHKERFENMNMKFSQYGEEARHRWGNETVDQVSSKLNHLSKDEQIELSDSWDSIFNKLASLRNHSPKSKEVQIVIKQWYDFLNKNFSYYSLDAFYGLGQLYIQDERFTKNIDQYGEGLASFMSEAMKVFTTLHKRGNSYENYD